MVLTEYGHGVSCEAGTFCITDWLNFSNPLVVQTTAPTSSGGLEMTGTFAYTANFGTSTVTFEVDRVANTSSTRTSGTLRLELWAMSQPYQGQNSISGYRFFKAVLPAACGLGNGQLGPNQGCTQIQLSGSVDNAPPAATYHVAAFLDEYDSNSCTTSDHFCIAVGRGFTNQMTVAAVTAPTTTPTTPATPAPSSSGGGGGGGAIDDVMLAGLLVLTALRRASRLSALRTSE